MCYQCTKSCIKCCHNVWSVVTMCQVFYQMLSQCIKCCLKVLSQCTKHWLSVSNVVSSAISNVSSVISNVVTVYQVLSQAMSWCNNCYLKHSLKFSVAWTCVLWETQPTVPVFNKAPLRSSHWILEMSCLRRHSVTLIARLVRGPQSY